MRGLASKVAHSHGWQVDIHYWWKGSILFTWVTPHECLYSCNMSTELFHSEQFKGEREPGRRYPFNDLRMGVTKYHFSIFYTSEEMDKSSLHSQGFLPKYLLQTHRFLCILTC